MERNIEAARGAGLGGQWGGTFLGGQARETGAKQDTMLDDLQKQSELSGLDLAKSGIIGGISGYTTGQMGAGIGEGIAATKAAEATAQGLSKDAAKELATANLTDATAEGYVTDELMKKSFGDLTREELIQIQQSGFLGADAPYLKAIFGKEGFGQDPTTLLEEGTGGSATNIGLILEQMGVR